MLSLATWIFRPEYEFEQAFESLINTSMVHECMSLLYNNFVKINLENWTIQLKSERAPLDWKMENSQALCPDLARRFR